MDQRSWPAALTLLALVVLGAFLLYTERIVREVRTEAAMHTRMYALVQEGLLSLEPGADLQALIEVQRTLTELGVPVVAVNEQGEPYAVANLPFKADLAVPADRRRILDYVRRLDRQNPPIHEPGAGTIHFGAPPIIAWLRWAPWFQVGVALILGGIGFVVVRSHVRADRERFWAATARELAHQMGTPLSSLAGWVELLRLPAAERDALVPTERIAQEIGADVERLERVSRRFELIGKPPALEVVDVVGVVEELERYFRPRLPRLGSGVRLGARVSRGIPAVRANRVLLVWALENVVKNALDALAGRGGRIRIAAAPVASGYVRFSVTDTGPGIAPVVRDRLFTPGVTTQVGGWGVGHSLTRRIIEDLHAGRVTARSRRGGGTVFEIDLPVADSGAPGAREAVERPGSGGVSRTE